MFLLRWFVLFIKPLISRFPRVAAVYRGLRDQLDYMEEPQRTPWGFKLAGNSEMKQGTFEPAETELVRKLLEEVDVLINVGANVGYYCCHALSMEKSVIAFEPMNRNLRYLCKNIKANGWSGVEILPVALSNSVDVLNIYGENTGASLVAGWAGISEGHSTLVPSSTMDIMLNTRLQGKRVLILVDIEGAEKRMLDGAGLMLKSSPKPIWIVEIVTNENQPQDGGVNPYFLSTFSTFFDNGYEAFQVDENMQSVTREDVNLLFRGVKKANTYNYLFRAKETSP